MQRLSYIYFNTEKWIQTRRCAKYDFRRIQAGIKSIHRIGRLVPKTKYKGPAVLTFSNFEYEECSIYIARVRNSLAGIDYSTTAPVCVSWNGRKVISSLLRDQFSSFFQRKTYHNLVSRRNRHITATLVRKCLVSKVHIKKTELKQDLGIMLCHTVKYRRVC